MINQYIGSVKWKARIASAIRPDINYQIVNMIFLNFFK